MVRRGRNPTICVREIFCNIRIQFAHQMHDLRRNRSAAVVGAEVAARGSVGIDRVLTDSDVPATLKIQLAKAKAGGAIRTSSPRRSGHGFVCLQTGERFEGSLFHDDSGRTGMSNCKMKYTPPIFTRRNIRVLSLHCRLR